MADAENGQNSVALADQARAWAIDAREIAEASDDLDEVVAALTEALDWILALTEP